MSTPPPYYGPPQGQPMPPQNPSNGLGIAGMVVGIVSLPLVCCGWIGSLVGVVGAILSFLGLQKAKAGQATNRGMAMAGLICSAIAIVLGIALTIFATSIDVNQLQEWVDSNSTTAP